MSEEQGLSPEEAKELLLKQRQEKIQACTEEINKVLEKHDCSLNVAMLVTEKGNYPQLQVVTNS